MFYLFRGVFQWTSQAHDAATHPVLCLRMTKTLPEENTILRWCPAKFRMCVACGTTPQPPQHPITPHHTPTTPPSHPPTPTNPHQPPPHPHNPSHPNELQSLCLQSPTRPKHPAFATTHSLSWETILPVNETCGYLLASNPLRQ